MKKLSILILAAAMFLCLCPPASRAAEITLFVHNREFTDQTCFVKDVLYAPLESLLKAMKYGWTQTGNTVELKPADSSSPSALTGEKLTFSFKGKIFSPAVISKGGILFVSVPEMAQGLEAQFELNRDTGIADVIRPRVMTPEEIRQEQKAVETAKSEAAQKSQETGKTGESGEGEEKSPIEMSVDAYPERDMSGSWVTYFRPRATIKNTSQETVKKVVVTLHYQDLAGKDLNSETKAVGDMAPGQVVTYDYYWVNSSGIEVKVLMSEEHEKPKKEESGKKK